MNREIKLRGKCIKTGQWVYGYYMSFLFEKYGGDFPQDETGYYILPIRIDSFGLPVQREEDEYVRVDPKTVGQFTGLHDKNGKEIWEGDVVSCWDDAAKDPFWGLDKVHTGEIIFAAPAFVLSIPGKLIYNTPAVKQWENNVILTHWCDAENIEVIGNIYSDPHLIS